MSTCNRLDLESLARLLTDYACPKTSPGTKFASPNFPFVFMYISLGHQGQGIKGLAPNLSYVCT